MYITVRESPVLSFSVSSCFFFFWSSVLELAVVSCHLAFPDVRPVLRRTVATSRNARLGAVEAKVTPLKRGPRLHLE